MKASYVDFKHRVPPFRSGSFGNIAAAHGVTIKAITDARDGRDPFPAIGGWPKQFAKCGNLNREIAFLDYSIRP